MSSVRIHRHVRIPMPDGTGLSADIYLPPAGAGPVGAAIEYLPYRKDDLRMPIEWRHRALAARGVASVRLDIRGTGSSEGAIVDEYLPQEWADGAAAMEWLAAQPWCNGRLGLWGISYGGFNALQIAATAPEPLEAVVAVHFTDDRYTDDVHYGGGSLRAWDWTNYALRMVAMNGLPPDVDYVSDWADVWQRRLELEPWTLRWLREQVAGDYWTSGSLRSDYSRIRCPTYLIGGWHDGYRNAPLRTYQGLQCPKKLLVGPWSHSLPDSGIPGPHVSFVDELARWFGHWLNGADTGVMDEDPVTLFVQDAQPPDPVAPECPGTWITASDLPRVTPTDFFLTGDRSLVGAAPAVRAYGIVVPDAPWAGVFAGVWCPSNPPRVRASDQRLEEPASAVFSSPPLQESLVLLGGCTVRLGVTAAAEVAQLAVKLCDVRPDGAATLVTRGVLNLTRRHGFASPVAIVPEEAFDVTVPLDVTAWTFPAGHRLQLLVASGDWPNVWPAPHAARLRIGAADGAALTLPALDLAACRTTELAPPDAQEVADPAAAPQRSADWSYRRRLLTEMHEVATSSRSVFSVPAKELEVEERHETLLSVDGRAPAHARSAGEIAFVLRRPHLEIASRARTELRSTATSFEAAIQLEVEVDGETAHRLSWTESVPRELM
jgi:putative CocE/NonD family hydrolase